MAESIYKLGGITVHPTEFDYQPRRPLGIQGDGRAVYPGTRTAQMTWNFTSYEEWANVIHVFNQIVSDGDLVVQVPAYPTVSGSSYAFTEYSGCFVSEPQLGPFFADYPSNVKLLIYGIAAE